MVSLITCYLLSYESSFIFRFTMKSYEFYLYYNISKISKITIPNDHISD